MKKNNSINHGAYCLWLGLIGLFTDPTCFAWDRIITLNPMVSEWTAEILGKTLSLQKIIGVSEYSNYPEFMKKINTIGPYPQIQIEGILALRPDLIIASAEYNRADQLDQLRKLKLNVVVLPRENFYKMEEWILGLGQILHEEKPAKNVASEWKKSLSGIKSPTIKKRVFFEIQFQPLITVGRDSFLNDAFKLIGFENIFESIPQSYPKISREAVLEKKPERVFVFEMIKDQEDLEKIKLAWKNSRVEVLNGDDFSRCSPRLLHALKGVK